MILIVASVKDIASINIRRQLLANYDFLELKDTFHDNQIYYTTVNNQEIKMITINEEAIHYDAVADFLSAKLVIYISRHSSKSGIPTLSVHVPGNLGQAQKGGISGKVSIAPANAMKEALLEMTRQKAIKRLNHKVSYECTHHGPSLETPTMFLELGTSPTQWQDTKAAEAVAHATIASITNCTKSSTAAVGIGGPHYNEKFTRMALKDAFAFGHIIPKYAVSRVDQDIILQCIERTVEIVETIVLDWKGIKGADKPQLMKNLREVNIKIQKT